MRDYYLEWQIKLRKRSSLSYKEVDIILTTFDYFDSRKIRRNIKYIYRNHKLPLRFSLAIFHQTSNCNINSYRFYTHIT